MASDISFVIALPTPWIEIDGPNTSADEAIWNGLAPDILKQFGVDDPDLRRTMLWWLRQVRKKGLALIATYSESLDETSGGGAAPEEKDDAGVIGAAMSLAFVTREELGVDDLIRVNPGVLIAALEQTTESAWEPLRPPSRIELACGPSVERIRMLRDGDTRLLEVGYFVPLLDGQLLGLASFITPSVFVADEFTDLFQSIIDTLEVFDETVMSAAQPTTVG